MQNSYDDFSDQYDPFEQSANSRTIIDLVEELNSRSANSPWLRNGARCSHCQTLVPYNNLFVCSKSQCESAIDISKSINFSGDFYNTEKVFCGNCSFRGVHHHHNEYMIEAEQHVIDKSSQHFGAQVQRRFDILCTLNHDETIQLAIYEQWIREMKVKPTLSLVNFLKNAKNSMDWVARIRKINEFCHKVDRKREEAKNILKRLIKEEMSFFDAFEKEVQCDAHAKMKENEQKRMEPPMSCRKAPEVEKSENLSKHSRSRLESRERSRRVESFLEDQARIYQELDFEVGGFDNTFEKTSTKRSKSLEPQPNRDQIKQCPESENLPPRIVKHDDFEIRDYDVTDSDSDHSENDQIQKALVESIATSRTNQGTSDVPIGGFHAGFQRAMGKMSMNGPSTSKKTDEELEWERIQREEQVTSKRALREMQDQYFERENQKVSKEPHKSTTDSNFHTKPGFWDAVPSKRTESAGNVLQNHNETPGAPPPSRFQNQNFGNSERRLQRSHQSEWFLKATGKWDEAERRRTEYSGFRRGGNWQQKNREFHGPSNDTKNREGSKESEEDQRYAATVRQVFTEWDSGRRTEEEIMRVAEQNNGFGFAAFVKSAAGSQFAEEKKENGEQDKALEEKIQRAYEQNLHANHRPLRAPTSSTSQVDERANQQSPKNKIEEDREPEADTSEPFDQIEGWHYPVQPPVSDRRLLEVSCSSLIQLFEEVCETSGTESALLKTAVRLDAMQSLTVEQKEEVAKVFEQRTTFSLQPPNRNPPSRERKISAKSLGI